MDRFCDSTIRLSARYSKHRKDAPYNIVLFSSIL